MIKACNLNKSSVVTINGMPHVVDTISVHSPTARGGATLYKVRFRNVQTKQKVDHTLKGDDQLEEGTFETREAQFLYKAGDMYTFMDLETYDQFDMPEEDLSETIPFLIEDMEGLSVMISDERVLAVAPPDVVELEITECDPSIKGASATARSKPATLQTGLIIQVPEYIAQGDIARVDSKTREFLGRGK